VSHLKLTELLCLCSPLYCDPETGVRGHSGYRKRHHSIEHAARTTLYSSSIVTMPLSLTVSEISSLIGRKSLPLVFGAPVGCDALRFTQRPLVAKTRMMSLAGGKGTSMIRSAVLIQYTRDGRTYRRTDRH